MKRIILSILYIIPFIAISQDFEKIYLKEDYLSYHESIFKLSDDKSFNMLNKFYFSLEDFKNKKIAYPESKDGITSSRDSLMNREFMVSDIIFDNGVKIKKGDPSLWENKIFVLKDISNGEVILFKYIEDNIYNFPFLVKLSDFHNKKVKEDFDNRFKKSLVVNIDEFTGQKKIMSPSNLSLSDKLYTGDTKVRLIKIIIKGVSSYYLSLNTHGSTYNVGDKGVIILFKDGTKLNKPLVDIDVSSSYGSGWEYSAFIKLNQSDLNLLKTKSINKFRLYIYDDSLTEEISNNFKEIVKEIIISK
ncbi:hypothetical protein [Sphingobacterium faecium]|uniref:hypothetical protein n=1 Tax=Sphingobacterium faecium TaxID=34087 RepID=UPI002468697E|nr:hypothetical protein [Sphingobacterium faecium]MDH5825814.1 hypothetical protein [Sphingobacterium faecium]